MTERSRELILASAMAFSEALKYLRDVREKLDLLSRLSHSLVCPLTIVHETSQALSGLAHCARA